MNTAAPSMPMRTVCKEDIKGRFTIMFILGEGTFGKVMKAIDRENNKLVAIKIIENCFDSSKSSNNKGQGEIKGEILDEIKSLLNLQHKNIVRLEDYFLCDNKVYIIMEYCTNGSIAQHKMRINEQILLAITRDVAMALDYIHEQNGVHCDVKPQNILLTNTCDIRLADFGIAITQEKKVFSSSKESIKRSAKTNESRGTSLYMAPEVAAGLAPSPKSDIYSLGMTLFEMASGLPLGLTLSKTFEEWIKVNDTVLPNGDKWSQKLISLIETMLNPNPSSRPSASDVIAAIGDVGETWLIASQLIKPDTSILY